MADFPSITPSYGTRKSSSPQTLAVQYGDGYSTRLVFGLNQDLKEYSLRWDNLSEANANSIETFLEARKGQESFNFTPTEESSARKCICIKWTREMRYTNRASIRATFQEVAEP